MGNIKADIPEQAKRWLEQQPCVVVAVTGSDWLNGEYVPKFIELVKEIRKLTELDLRESKDLGERLRDNHYVELSIPFHNLGKLKSSSLQFSIPQILDSLNAFSTFIQCQFADEAEDVFVREPIANASPRRMAMYIVIKDDVPDNFAIVAASHAPIACYFKYENDVLMREWRSGIFYKRIVMANEKEFEKLKSHSGYVVITESSLDDREVALAFKPRPEWPKVFKFLRLWKPTESMYKQLVEKEQKK